MGYKIYEAFDGAIAWTQYLWNGESTAYTAIGLDVRLYIYTPYAICFEDYRIMGYQWKLPQNV